MYRIRSHIHRRRKNHTRSRKSGKGNKFPSSVRERIKRRDHWQCVKCGNQMFNIHHIKPRSEGGKGIDVNGICACEQCHHWFHSDPKGRIWAEWYQQEVLIPWQHQHQHQHK